ncbi:MAG: hypothetical protein JJT96_15585 [Opitutales bacterium]|nr:hypothetical protein [Opitutales bacterium]
MPPLSSLINRLRLSALWGCGLFIGLFLPTLEAQISVLPLRGEVMIDRGGERPERIREITSFDPGESLLTGQASTAILLLPSGARLSLQSEARLVFSTEGSPAEISGAHVPLFVLHSGFAGIQVPREAISEGLHVGTDAGTVVAELGTSMINTLTDRSDQRVVMIGVDSGRLRLVPSWEGGENIPVMQGDAITLTQLPVTADDPPPQVQEQILVGDLRTRLLSALQDINNAQTAVVVSRERNRPTQAVSSLPRADRMPRPFPATGKLPPEELLRR